MPKRQNLIFKYQGYRIDFSEEKNLLLKETRGVGFEEIISTIEKGDILDDIKHRSKRYAHQKILIVKHQNYAYAIPYVIDTKNRIIFLKTAYPSRVLTDKFLKGGKKK